MKLSISNVPNTLDDCSKKQLVEIINISKNRSLSIEQKRIKIFFLLINNQGDFFEKINFWFQLKFKPWWIKTKLGIWFHTEKGLDIDINIPDFDLEDLVLDVYDHTQFLFEESQTLFTQKIKRLGLYLRGPEEYFQNLSFRQFRDADSEYYAMLEEFEHTKKLSITDEFILSLYKPINFIFVPTKIKASEAEREIILMFYLTNRKQLEIEFPNVFKKKSGKTSKQSIQDYTEMWENILDEVAGKPQEYTKVDELNVRSVLKNIDRAFAKIDAQQLAYDNARLH